LPSADAVGKFDGVPSLIHFTRRFSRPILLIGASLAIVAISPSYSANSKVDLPILTVTEPQRAPELPITQLVIRLRDDVTSGRLVRPSSARLELLSNRAGERLIYRRPTADLSHVLRLDEPLQRVAAERVAQRLRLDPSVASVEIDEYVFPFLTPTDPFWTDSREVLWHLKAPTAQRPGGANLPEAWDTAVGRNVTVAVIDSGITTHLDLDTNIIRGHDFISADTDGRFLVANDGDGRDADPADPGDWIDDSDLTKTVFSGGSSPCKKANSSWHGTHVAGTIGAVTGNGAGIVGVAHEAKILAIRALGKCFGYGSDITDAIRWAAGAQPVSGTWTELGIPTNSNPARVINLSLGSTSSSCSSSRQNAITAARALGAVVVAATGNDSRATISSPANCIGVIAVTAHTVEGDKAVYANHGVGTTLSAPGGGSCTTSALNCLPQSDSGAAGTLWRLITSTTNSGTTSPGAIAYSGKSGTSMATPHVSGVAALLISAMPTLTVESVRQLLTSSVREFPAGTFCAGKVDNPCGAGMLDATRAMQRLAALTPTVTASANAAVVENGSTVTLTGTATPKAGGNLNLTYRWQQITGATATLSGTSSPQVTFIAPNGSRMSFRLTVTDSDGFAASANIDVRSNGTPILAALPPVSASAGATVSFRASASDPDNDALSYSATGIPAGAVLNASTGEFSWPNAVAGTYTVTISASDGLATSAAQSVTITVTAPRGGGGALDLWTLLLLGAALAWQRRLQHRRTT
jgi:serine protease